ncbi:unnamed protein product [Mycena citricolor]|uniref:Ras GEF n=1 Tax=Mycena citricolor TaxID=2018698 RepID=A0AAD2H7M4_9AGAR|nr:unnamed protein product [Mycena citricolor]
MAAVAAPMYSSHNNAFFSSSSRTNSSTLMASHSSQGMWIMTTGMWETPAHYPTLPTANSAASSMDMEPMIEEEQFTTLFCRALYDYDAQDASALSFRQNDIIEVLTQQPSGWWDGLLGDERGWFPSNYVTVISDEEAEMAFSSPEIPHPERSAADTKHNADTSSVLDMSHAMMRGTGMENEEWLESEMGGMQGGGMDELANSTMAGPLESSDFWMPEVTSDGQIYYVNTKTGQHARDLPNESDGDTSDSDFNGLGSQSSSRSGTGLGYSNGYNASGSAAGFGLLRRTGTPEPWVKKLADDGMSYYYYNPTDGSTQWTRPESRETAHTRDRSVPSTNRTVAASTSNGSLAPAIRPLPSTSDLTPPKSSRLSVYSDDSDIQPSMDIGRSRQYTQKAIVRPTVDVKMELTSAERIAQTLQQALAPPPPEIVTDLSAIARSAIQSVVENLESPGVGRRVSDDRVMDGMVSSVVFAVRNLLYVSAASPGQIPNHLLPRSLRNTEAQTSSSPLKPAQRRVTATLSRLVLSARALEYDAGSTAADTLDRIQVDAEELERAVLSFVLEVQRLEHSRTDLKPPKRLEAVFMTANIGLGLLGAGAAASWKGMGWVSLDEKDAPKETLTMDVVSELAARAQELNRSFVSLEQVVQARGDDCVDVIREQTRLFVARMSSWLQFAADIHVARHVDIDGIRQDTGSTGPNEMYMQTVERARSLIRTLEHALQSLYDDSASILVTTLGLRQLDPGVSPQTLDANFELLLALGTAAKANMEAANRTFEGLLSIGHEQADIAQGDYNGSIDWRMSRLSVIDTQLGGAMRPLSAFDPEVHGDLVDLAAALARPPVKNHVTNPSYDSLRPQSNATSTLNGSRDYDQSMDSTIGPDDDDLLDGSPNYDDEFEAKAKSPPRSGKNKLTQMLGPDFLRAGPPQPPTPEPEERPPRPWYLQASYSPTDISIDQDGAVRAGTISALVERLTAHEQADPTFIKSFLMTFKSFTTVDELFDLLVQRFRIQPPANLTPGEREEWGKLKQHVIQIRVLNIFKSMVIDDDVLDKDDLFILDRMKDFLSSDELAKFPAAKQLLNNIERQKGGDSKMRMVTAPQGTPPPPLVPKTSKKLKLLDIEPLELARQLTIMESQLYQRIRPMECLQRAREQRTEDNMDNITTVIQTSNKIALWVAESVLSKEDSRRRANAVKHLISVADRCRALNNFSTMAAITAGLNAPPIRRLKRTWEQVNQRYMSQFGACEMTIDSGKNFTKYRSVMTHVIPPCVPFIGVFLTTLQFIQDGNPDNVPGPAGPENAPPTTLVNFRKRQKASEVINDIKRWQVPFNFHVIPSIQAYIEESLNAVSDTKESSERFWAISLEREPREREDEKMARLLQESGFL